MSKNHRKKVALLIDTANSRKLDFKRVLRTARRHGDLAVIHAYGNFANHHDLGEAAEQLFLLGVRLVHCPAWRNGSNEWKTAADELLMSDAVALIHSRSPVTRFIICSGDGHFVPTLCAIKQQGREAFVMADPNAASRQLIKAADRFIPIPPPALPSAKGEHLPRQPEQRVS